MAALILSGLGACLSVDFVYRQTTIYRAVRNNNEAAVRSLLARDPTEARRQSPMLGITPLHIAAENGNQGIAELLLANGADPNTVRESKLTPLQLAAFGDHVSIAELLIEHGADIDQKGWRHNDTPLQVAATHGYVDMIELLLRHGAGRNYRDMLGKTALDMAREGGYTNAVELLMAPQTGKGIDKDS